MGYTNVSFLIFLTEMASNQAQFAIDEEKKQKCPDHRRLKFVCETCGWAPACRYEI